MEENDLGKSIKKVFSGKNFPAVFFTSMVSLLLMLAIGLGMVWYNRARIFSFFAQEYVKEAQNKDTDDAGSVTEKIIEKQSMIFSQDKFVVEAVKKTNPAVVSIIISKEVPKYEAYVDPN